MIQFCKNLAHNENFQTFILFLILLTSVSMGVETIPHFAENYGDIFWYIFCATQIIFAVEIVVRLIAYSPNVSHFLKDKWNTFDFIVVVLSFLPGIGSFALIGRLLRVLRVLRLISVSDRLRGFMERIKEVFDEMAFVGLVGFIFGYIFSISGYYLFSDIDPSWNSLGNSALNLFYLLLLQDVREYTHPLLTYCKAYIIYFVLFYFCFLSLVIGTINAAICDSMVQRK